MKPKRIEKPLLERPALLVLDAPPADFMPEAEVLAGAGVDCEFLDPGDQESLERADFILTWRTPVDEAMIRRARRCLVILHYGPGGGRGVARVALEPAREEGIYVVSIPDFDTRSWVDETFRMIDEIFNVRAKACTPNELKGMRLGLVGFGQVGREVARIAVAKKMEVWVCDPFAPPEPFLTADVKPADLATLCGVADILSLHVPIGAATRGMIGEDELLMMKSGSVLINTADPELVDLNALAAALDRGRPRVAAFDEDLGGILLAGDALLSHSGLRHGPRRAGAGEASMIARRRAAAERVIDILRGNRPPHLLIDPPCPRHILLLASQGR